jgi:hypothetical protein
MDGPSDEIHPRQGGGEGETSHNGVERLGFEFTGDRDEGIGGNFGGHFYNI